MITFFSTVTEQPLNTPAPYSFWRDPHTGESILTEECVTGYQIRRNLNVGFDDTAVEFISKEEAVTIVIKHDFFYKDKFRLQVALTRILLMLQISDI